MKGVGENLQGIVNKREETAWGTYSMRERGLL
jgi:hypothetical protein